MQVSGDQRVRARPVRLFDVGHMSQQQLAVVRDGEEFSGSPLAGLPELSELHIACGRLESWVTSEPVAVAGVFPASAAAVASLRFGAFPDFVLVRVDPNAELRNGVMAMTLQEAYERHLREATGLQWHARSKSLSR